MKRGLILGIFSFLLILTGFASAQTFSFSEFLSGIDPSVVTLGIAFLIIFIVLQFSLSKVLFRDNPTISVVVAISMSLLAVYWINNLTNLGNLLLEFVPDNLIYTVGPILALAVIIFFFVKVRFGVFVILGGLVLSIAVANLVPSSDIITVVGIVMIVIGLIGMISKGGRLRSLQARYNKIQRRNPGDIRLRRILYKINQLRPGFGQIKP